jgi:hypothetical protein
MYRVFFEGSLEATRSPPAGPPQQRRQQQREREAEAAGGVLRQAPVREAVDVAADEVGEPCRPALSGSAC